MFYLNTAVLYLTIFAYYSPTLPHFRGNKGIFILLDLTQNQMTLTFYIQNVSVI